ncbi:helix-turn-helix domain-containing protein [Cellulomonas aerilata]|uniref:HTH cro/C1-type domain-containing protein n=1 Tax=Cellulomonas aerilata TaxID=515326 RepID=A0A512DBG8_9CELL|nr:helix-turn-helix transcriptional regulator [Cellulomonas aerilata]GEO33831.1 hypothetical protein CAE01nite_15560 [Cellulomonas aerilata]
MEPADVLRPHRADARAAWRRAIGQVLRRRRAQTGLRLTDVALRAGVSPQYLSEVERGRKEASSEILAAVTAALGLSLLDLAQGVAGELRAAPTLTLTSTPSGASVGETVPATARMARVAGRGTPAGRDVVALAA